MRYVEFLCENVKVQRGLEVLADAILAVLAAKIPAGVAGYEGYHGPSKGIPISDLARCHANLDIEPKTIPMPIRRLARKILTIRLGGEDSFVTSGRRGLPFFEYQITITVPDGFNLKVIKDSTLLAQVLSATRPSLVHELTHAWNDLQSKGRFTQNKQSAATKTSFGRYNDDPSEATQAAWSHAYLNDPAEINAAFQAAVTATPIASEFTSYADRFYDKLPQFSHWPRGVRERLQKRLYKHWSSVTK